MPGENYPRAWKDTRRYVLDRDGWRCAWCNKDLTTHDAKPTADHVVPIAVARLEGWTEKEIHHPDNVVASCHSCNYKRGDRLGPPRRRKKQNQKPGGFLTVESTSGPVGEGSLSPVMTPRAEPERGQRWRMKPKGGQ